MLRLSPRFVIRCLVIMACVMSHTSVCVGLAYGQLSRLLLVDETRAPENFSWMPDGHVMPEAQQPGIYQTEPYSSGQAETLSLAPAQTSWLDEGWFERKSTTLTGTAVLGSGDDYGVTDFSISSGYKVRALPLLSFTPSYQMLFLNGPERTDLPETLYRANVDIAWFQPLSQQWFLQLAVTPGVAADFHTTNSDMVRIMGRALAFYQANEQFQWAFGAVYLARNDLPVLPAVGLIYTPSELTKLELIFPRPKFSHQLSAGHENSVWWYVAGELGGGTYAITRSSGVEDVVSLGEFKLLTGIEHRWGNDPKKQDILFYEVGYVFNRQVEYDSEIGDYDPSGAVVLRAGITF